MLLHVRSGPKIHFNGVHTYSEPQSRFLQPLSHLTTGTSTYVVRGTASSRETFADGALQHDPYPFSGNSRLTRLFADADGQRSIGHPIISALCYDRALSNREVDSIISYYGGNRKLENSVLMLNGDSITNGETTSSSDKPYWAVAAKLSGSNICHKAVNGRTMSGISATPSDLLPVSAWRKNIHVVFAGTNDLATSVGAEPKLRHDFETYCRTIRRSNPFARIVVCSILDRSTMFSGNQTILGFQADRDSFNSWLRINHSGFSDALCDFAQSDRIGHFGSSMGPDFKDGVHLNDNGHRVAGEMLFSCIQSLE